MNLKNTLQEYKNRLDFCGRQLAIAEVTKNHADIDKLNKEINELKAKIAEAQKEQKNQLSDKAQKIVNMNFILYFQFFYKYFKIKV